MDKRAEIRLNNAMMLFKQSGLKNYEFADSFGVKPTYWGQIKTGKPIGNGIARRIEHAFNKEKYWIDAPQWGSDSLPYNSERRPINTIGERIKKRRVELGLNQPELAKIIGLSKAAVGRLENGQSKTPSTVNLLKYSNALKVDVEWLVTGKGDMLASYEINNVGIFSERVKLARKLIELNQSETARRIGVSREAVSQWENGKTKNISSELLHKAAKVYGVGAEWLATGRGAMLSDNSIDTRTNNNLPADAQALLKTYFELTDERKVELQRIALIQKRLQLDEFETE